MIRTAIISMIFVITGIYSLPTLNGQAGDPLHFRSANYTLETITVKTSAGEKSVTYRSYMHLPYVSNPVDIDYQSLDVSVPVSVDGMDIDATNAPILFSIGVGGYMSVRNAGADPRGESSGGPPRGGRNGSVSSTEDLALAAGFVVVSPGCRGRDNRSPDGTYYGKAPAAIVDLKAAVRYIRYNDDTMPGNADWIVSTGCSAGGALSALLGASGNSPLYDEYLTEIGAAGVGDHIYASSCYSPITDLEHSDMAYEWMYGTTPARNGLVDQELSGQLKSLYEEYQSSLKLQGKNGFGPLTADNYGRYILKYYVIPSASKFLSEASTDDRDAYLAGNSWISWSGTAAEFSFEDYVSHVGRMKGLPAFDDFEMRQPEPVLFGTATENARHFTNFSLRHSSGNPDAEIDSELKEIVNMMNAMYFVGQDNSDCSNYWWVRNGTSDNHTSMTVFANLVTSLETRNKQVNAWLYWDGGHCANDDPENFITWISKITGFPGAPGK